MRRRHRIVLVTLVGVTSVFVVLALGLLGSASEGPISATLQRVGSGVSRLESLLVRRVRGTSRTQELAWLEPFRTDAGALRAPDTLLLGAYDGAVDRTLEEVLDLERSLEVALPLVQIYTAWGDAPDQGFPGRILEAIHALGSVPLVTWEPWLTTFENRLHPDLPLRADRDDHGLASIARGDYDFYLDEWARQAAAYEAPIFVRLAHEMNDPYRYPWGPQNNEPQEFIDAWRRVVDRFRVAGAENVVWVWAPHVAYAGYEAYWPGDDYVDWVATGALNYGTVAYWSQWWTFEQIFGQHYDFLSGFGKPLMIAEFGSLAVGGDRAAWYREALEGLRVRFPQVKALLFFHVEGDATVTAQAVDWSFTRDSSVVQAVREALSEAGRSLSDEPPGGAR